MFRRFLVKCLIVGTLCTEKAGFISLKPLFNKMDYLLHLSNIIEPITLLHFKNNYTDK